MRVFFVLLFLMSLPSAGALDLSHYHFQKGCSLSDSRETVRTFPGSLCAFLSDGSFVSAGSDGIRRYNPDGSVRWYSPGSFHHQLNLSGDGTRILTLAYDDVTRSARPERDDRFLILDAASGKILFQKNARDLLLENELSPLNWHTIPLWFKDQKDQRYETSHFNSIYEVPPNAKESKVPSLRRGNIVVNSPGLGIFILSPDLSKILYRNDYPGSVRNNLHDVQVNGEGNFLIYNNSVANPRERFPYSALEIFDPVAKKLVFQFTAEPKALFYASSCGGIQELGPDILVFSHVMTG